MVLLKRSMLLAIHSNLATSNPVPQGAHEVRSRAMSGTARVVANSSKSLRAPHPVPLAKVQESWKQQTPSRVPHHPCLPLTCRK